MSETEFLSRANEFLTAFSNEQVPLMGICTPTVIAVNEHACTVAIPLNERTKNHLGCMYFGALHIGADTAGGLLAMVEIQKSGRAVSLIFKDAQAKFLRRAEGDVHFSCTSGEVVRKAVQQTCSSKERVNVPIAVVATVPSVSQSELVAQFTLTLSLKCVD